MKAAAEGGQAMLLAAVLLLVSCLLLLGLFQAGLMVREKIRLQTAADLAVLSALNTEANSLNALAVANRALLAQDALAARMNAMVSEAAFYHRMLDAASWVARIVPCGGPLLGQALGRGGEELERICRRASSLGVPALSRADALIMLQSKAVRLSLLLAPREAAGNSLALNAPRARLSLPAQAALLDQGGRLAGAISPLAAAKAVPLLEKTMDRHTLRRDWGARAGLLPIRKTGGTVIEKGDFRAFDRLQFRVFSRSRWRWRTIVSTLSRASGFSYPRHGELLGLDPGASRLGLTLTLRQDPGEPLPLLPPQDVPVTAVSSGELFYRRGDAPGEGPNLMNPFWHARLIPVERERGARLQIPPLLLAGTLH